MAETPRRGPRIFGHPVHPMVVGFPVAFWVGGFVWDLVALFRPDPLWPRFAFWTLVFGLVAALPAAASGFWELIALPDGHPGEKIAWWHMGIMSTALCLVLASVLLRRGTLGAEAAPWTAVFLAGLGAALTLAGGWLGGELVFRHGVAVERDLPSHPRE